MLPGRDRAHARAEYFREGVMPATLKIDLARARFGVLLATPRRERFPEDEAARRRSIRQPVSYCSQ